MTVIVIVAMIVALLAVLTVSTEVKAWKTIVNKDDIIDKMCLKVMNITI